MSYGLKNENPLCEYRINECIHYENNVLYSLIKKKIGYTRESSSDAINKLKKKELDFQESNFGEISIFCLLTVWIMIG